MMLAATCYSRDELERYLHGQMEDDVSGAIEEHLESCLRCEDTLCELDTGDDTLIRTLRLKDSDQSHAPYWVEQMANHSFADAAPSPVNEEASPDPPDELGDYEIVGVLGRGGMSVVFAARHKHLGRLAALKALLPTTQQHAVSRERFAREMRAVGALDHPAIVRATDAGKWNDTLYLVMELIDGIDLNRVSRLEGLLRVADVCAIGVETARGLAHAHQQGVVHRDVKPSNLMLDRAGAVKILDFGLARMQSPSSDVSLQTTMGQLLGTLDYMAPEQASGAEVDARADVYALGATLFKLLTGAPPHGRSSEMPIIECLNRLATQDATRLDERRDDVPKGLVEAVAAMLERDPSRRIASVEEVAEQLMPFAAHADLPALAASAIEKKSGSLESSVGATKESLAEFLPRPLQIDASPPIKSTSAAVRMRALGPLSLTLIGAALVGLIFFGVIVTLQSPEGTIRIESELDNVKVELVDEKDRVEVITVDHGEAATTVRSGRYRIRLNSPSDGIEVTPQQFIIRRGEAVLAKVAKIADGEAPQRESAANVEARLQLAETAAELAEAKQQPNPDAEAIKILEEKLARLRALSRPIPTEPVYEGRTLADWVAQMKFEQKEEVKSAAAENVLKLAGTRPGGEQMELIVEAGSRLFTWREIDLGQAILLEFRSVAPNAALAEAARLILKIDDDVAASHLGSALQSDQRRERDYGALLCVHLRFQLRQGGWPRLLAALQARRPDAADEAALAKLTLAACVPDASRAAELLSEIDANAALAPAIHAMFAAAKERKLEIPRNRQITWMATFLDKISKPETMAPFWQKPELGPFQNVDWDHVDDDLQADINAIVRPLLQSFEQRLAAVGDNPNDMMFQREAAQESNILTQVIDQANLTGETKDKAAALLALRLKQLIRLRSQGEEGLLQEMDTPASAAAAVMLLTGSVPDSIKRFDESESGVMTRRLAEGRNTLLPQAKRGAVMMRGSRGRSSPALANWHPYELLGLLHETTSHMHEATRRAAGSGRSVRYAPLSQMMAYQPAWQVDQRLMVDYAVTSGGKQDFSVSAAEFVGEYVATRDVEPYLRRHPQFAQAVAEWMEQAETSPAIEVSFKLWGATRTEQEEENKLLDWLKSGDAAHARFAIERLAADDADRFLGEWAAQVATAISRVADGGRVNARDLVWLNSLGDDAPNAASHALNFLKFWLEHPSERAHQTEVVGLDGLSALRACVDILAKNVGSLSDRAEQIEEEIQRVLKQSSDTISADDISQLQRLLRLLSKLGAIK